MEKYNGFNEAGIACYNFKLQSGLQMPYMLEFIKIGEEVFACSYQLLQSWQLVGKEKLVLHYGNEKVELSGFNLHKLCMHLSAHTLIWIKELRLESHELPKYSEAGDAVITSIKRLIREDVLSLDL